VSAREVIQNLFHRLGWDVRRSGYPNSEEVILKRFLALTRPSAVFDVGANVGQYGLSLRKCGFTGRIVSFEAMASVHARLVTLASQDQDWLVAPCCALGALPGQTSIYVARNSVSSSLLPMGDAHRQAAPDSGYVGSESVRVERLDNIGKALLPRDGKLLLKVDTQGYEEEVLAGAEALLERVCAMQLELSLAPLYQGAPDLRRMLELCENLGFKLHGVIPGFYEERTGRLLQMDGLFVRTDSA
jgi:FkbM family methyltransferase